MTRPDSNPVRLLAHMLASLFNSRAVFHREWKRYEAASRTADAVAGRWVGEWVSEKTGHRGELKCVLSAVAPCLYRAVFYASYSRLFRVGYATELKAESKSQSTLLKGEENLGPLAGGIYRCEGEVVGRNLTCRYSCKYDQGIFRLTRLDEK